jgi:hypothetical protein
VKAKANLDGMVYRGILRISMHEDRDTTREEDSERERWRESIRSLMLRQVRRRAGISEDDPALEGYVCACEGHNYAVASDMAQYAALNAKDVVDRVRRLLGQCDLKEEQLAQEEEEIEAWEGALKEEQPAQQEGITAQERDLEESHYPIPSDGWKRSGLADKFAHTKWAR